ncbi:MAG: hypothetical protein R2797_07770 [Gelidibacter sp.]
MRITNQQKSELAGIFKENKLNLIDFEISGKYEDFNIEYKFDYFSFCIVKKDPQKYQTIIKSIKNISSNVVNTNWDGVINNFRVWTKHLSVELNTPNGWETYENYDYLNSNIDDFKKSFSDEEKEFIRKGITYTKEKIKDLDIAPDSLKIIEKKLDELDIKLDELKKFDWKSLFIGTIASLIMSLGVPPESAGLLWEIIKSAFSGFKLNF